MRRRFQTRDLRHGRCRSTGAARRRRVVARRGGRALVYRAPGWSAAMLLALVAALVTGAAAVGYLLVGGVAAVVVTLAWLAFALRITSLLPAGPHGDGPAPPGGAGVREPRRPLPYAPAGGATISLSDEEPPQRAVALA